VKKGGVVVIFLLILIGTAEAQSDKVIHFGVSGAFGLVTDKILFSQYPNMDPVTRVLVSTAIGSVPGFIKEMTDSTFDNGDMAADVLGALAGSVVGELTNNRISLYHQRSGQYTTTGVLYNIPW
jgi:hypothetical protein